LIEVLIDLLHYLANSDSLEQVGLALFDHANVVTDAFHFISFLFNERPFVDPNDVHLALVYLIVGLALLCVSNLLVQLNLFLLVVLVPKVVGTLPNVLADEVELGLAHVVLLDHQFDIRVKGNNFIFTLLLRCSHLLRLKCLHLLNMGGVLLG
jgi:hypothetical protein